MRESGGVNASSSLAIVEKKPQRSGGCVGIFFHLFDWNRSFAKKKLFSKKLLPPSRAKQDAKKFGGDEKQHKLRLIADENSRGFPKAKKNGASEQKHGVKTPSLVARLMGLEAMPMVQIHDKLKNVSYTEKKDKREKTTSNIFEFGRENEELEKGGTKHELRPQKLQKTGLLERRPVTKFGTEALHFKNVLSRSKKHHPPPKLLSPVKGPKNHSVRHTSRLMGAATKILEPRNRAKSALRYSLNVGHCPTNELLSESMKSMFPENSNHYMNEVKSLKGQSSCKNCGNLLDVVDCRTNVDDIPSVFVAPTPSHKPGISLSSLEQENERVFRKSQKHSASLARAVDYIRNRANFTSDMIMMMPHYRGQAQGHLANQHSRPQTCPFSIGYKRKLQMQNEVRPIYQRNNRFMSASKGVSQTKDFVALNRNLSGQTRSKLPAKVDYFKFDTGKAFGNKREELSYGRKSRLMNVGKLGESSCNVNSTLDDEPRYINGSGNKNDAIAIRFSSSCNSSPRKTLANETDEKTWFQKPFPLTGDNLGALLDQKLKELNTQEEDERPFCVGIQPKRTSAIILQELICALTTERRPPQKEINFGPNAKHVSKYCGHSLISKMDLCFQGKSETAGVSFDHARDDHHGKGFVLEASSSNDSCLSSNLNANSGHVLHDETNYTYNELHHMNVESDDCYGGVSLNKQSSSRQLVIDLLNYICEVLFNIDLIVARLKGNKLNHAKEVIFNAELVLGHTALTSSHEIQSFSVSNFLLDELQTLASVLWTNFSNFLGFEDTKEGNQLKGFIFDCLIEYLDSTYGRYSKSRFGAWKSLPFCMNVEKMIQEVVEEVREWMSMSGLTRDELIATEMSHGLGRWTDFEIQVFETSVDIEWMILHSLVDEVVVDLYECLIGFGIPAANPFC